MGQRQLPGRVHADRGAAGHSVCLRGTSARAVLPRRSCVPRSPECGESAPLPPVRCLRQRHTHGRGLTFPTRPWRVRQRGRGLLRQAHRHYTVMSMPYGSVQSGCSSCRCMPVHTAAAQAQNRKCPTRARTRALHALTTGHGTVRAGAFGNAHVIFRHRCTALVGDFRNSQCWSALANELRGMARQCQETDRSNEFMQVASCT